jgi:hypothetical protein
MGSNRPGAEAVIRCLQKKNRFTVTLEELLCLFTMSYIKFKDQLSFWFVMSRGAACCSSYAKQRKVGVAIAVGPNCDKLRIDNHSQ